MGQRRIPSPDFIRPLLAKLKSGVGEDEREAIEQLLEVEEGKLSVTLPEELLPILSQVDPVLLEAYALLHQPRVVGELAKPQEATQETPQVEVSDARVSEDRSDPTAQAFVPGASTDASNGGPGGQISPADQLFTEVSALLTQAAGGSFLGEKRGQPIHPGPEPGPKMTLDEFQKAYRGQVSVPQSGRGKQTTTEVIAVHQELFESELAQFGDAVYQPAYWVPRHNRQTVYFAGEDMLDALEWVLGEHQASADVPASSKPTPEQLVQFLEDALEIDDHYSISAIKRHLRTPEQKRWFEENDITIPDLLEGRTLLSLETRWLLDQWNERLGVYLFGF